MPIAPANATFSTAGLPAWAQQLGAAIDTAIGSGWVILPDGSVPQREFEFLWANFGGFTAQKAIIVRDSVLPFYSGLGWTKAVGYPFRNSPAAKTNTTRFTLVFER
jgi:hypothetical protein